MSSEESEDEFQSADEGSEEEVLDIEAAVPSTISYVSQSPVEEKEEQKLFSMEKSEQLHRPTNNDNFIANPLTSQGISIENDDRHTRRPTRINNVKVINTVGLIAEKDDKCVKEEESRPIANILHQRLSLVSIPVIDSLPKTKNKSKEIDIDIGISSEKCNRSTSSRSSPGCIIENFPNESNIAELDNSMPKKKEIIISSAKKININENNTESMCMGRPIPVTSSEFYSEEKKLIKVSKIGLKKPRERLGEKLGIKKLGSRITKPLVGISSDSLARQDNETHDPIVSQPNLNDSKNMPSSKFLTQDVSANKGTGIDMPNSSSAWNSWGDWGSSIASAASILTNEVGKGVGTIMESVESGMGIPDAEILAKETVELEREQKDTNKTLLNEDIDAAETNFGFKFGGFTSLVSGVSGALESASSKVLSGGLDTLEKIGRQTMVFLQDGDPGLRRKRAFLKPRGSNLSLVLQEARQRALEEEEVMKVDSSEQSQSFKQISIKQIWGNTEGSAHSEALVLIANRCESKSTNLMQELPALGVNKLYPLIDQIKSTSEIKEDNEVEDVTNELTKFPTGVELPLQFGKIIKGWTSFDECVKRLSIQVRGSTNDEIELNEVQRDLYGEVASLVSDSIAVIHKAAELSLITHDLDCVLLAQQFQELCGCLSSGLEKSADEICEAITRCLPMSEAFVTASVTNVYVQMAESNALLQTSLQHLSVALIHAQVKQIAAQLL